MQLNAELHHNCLHAVLPGLEQKMQIWMRHITYFNFLSLLLTATRKISGLEKGCLDNKKKETQPFEVPSTAAAA